MSDKLSDKRCLLVEFSCFRTEALHLARALHDPRHGVAGAGTAPKDGGVGLAAQPLCSVRTKKEMSQKRKRRTLEMSSNLLLFFSQKNIQVLDVECCFCRNGFRFFRRFRPADRLGIVGSQFHLCFFVFQAFQQFSTEKKSSEKRFLLFQQLSRRLVVFQFQNIYASSG